MNGIKHKVSVVTDETCKECAHLYEGECRAFEMPHSAAERTQRDGKPMACLDYTNGTKSIPLGDPGPTAVPDDPLGDPGPDGVEP